MITMPGKIILEFSETGELTSKAIICSDSDQEERLRAALDRILKDEVKNTES